MCGGDSDCDPASGPHRKGVSMNKMKSKLCRRAFPALAAAVFMTALTAFPAFADTVKNIRLDFDDHYEVGEIQEPTVTCRTSGVEIDSITWSKDVENWNPGTSVTATIVLSSDNEFNSTYGKKLLRVDGATLSSAKTTSDGDLLVKVSYKPVVQLDSTEEAGWSILDNTKAVWKKVKYATGYEIQLYRDDYYLRTIDATGTSKSLKEYMTKEGYYYYEIRAVGKDSNDKQYRKSGEWIMSSNKQLEDLGTTDGDWKNYSEGKKYRNDDGSYVTSAWQKIVGDWYYFNSDGYAVTGWNQIGGSWYYMDANGIMLTGWQKINDVWYFLNSGGDMAIGWKECDPGKWYYFYSNGSMASGTVIDGYTLDASGLWIPA